MHIPLGKAGQQTDKGSAVSQGTAEAGRMCLSRTRVSETSILKKVAPELNRGRQACLDSQTSEAKNIPGRSSGESKGRTGMKAYGALGNYKWIGTMGLGWMQTSVGAMRREVGRHQVRRHSYAKMKGLNFVLEAVESYWRTSSRGRWLTM